MVKNVFIGVIIELVFFSCLYFSAVQAEHYIYAERAIAVIVLLYFLSGGVLLLLASSIVDALYSAGVEKLNSAASTPLLRSWSNWSTSLGILILCLMGWWVFAFLYLVGFFGVIYFRGVIDSKIREVT